MSSLGLLLKSAASFYAPIDPAVKVMISTLLRRVLVLPFQALVYFFFPFFVQAHTVVAEGQ
jgi:hypothetical protein